ncbi:MAG: ABC transporter ATP-binding protein, partial [Proteobacteria bacterium]|nr:ABC transporter ATP-binding protein [Pseudomonadota bacterium]
MGRDLLLSVEGMSICFGLPGTVRPVVDGVSFTVAEGETVAIVGESGSGKTLIGKALMGLLPKAAHCFQGRAMFHHGGRVIDLLGQGREKYRDLRGHTLSMIFQEPMSALSPLHRVGDQVGEVLRTHRLARGSGDERARVLEIFREVGLPDPERIYRAYPFELSGGLRQRAVIAMAMIAGPALVIADEPTTALDVTTQAMVLDLLRRLQSDRRMSVIMITHDLGVVANLADEVVVLYRGKVMERGTVTDIFSAPGHPYLKGLLNAVPRFNMKEGERLTPLRAISHSSSAYFSTARERKRKSPMGTPLLSVQSITKTFHIRSSGLFAKASAKPESTVRAVDDVSLDIMREECLGLVGESGCGKTTLSKIILAAIRPDSGKVIFDDDGHPTDVHALSTSRRRSFRRKAQFVFQDPFGSLNPRMTVAEIIAEPLVIHRIGDHASRMATVRESLDLVGLDIQALARYPHSFSGGQRQRIGIARALALKPDLLI